MRIGNRKDLLEALYKLIDARVIDGDSVDIIKEEIDEEYLEVLE